MEPDETPEESVTEARLMMLESAIIEALDHAAWATSFESSHRYTSILCKHIQPSQALYIKSMERITMSDVDTGNQPIERVFRDEARALWRALVVFTGGRREIAEDAVAEAFARALAHAASIRDPRAWVYKTAFRAAARELRRERADQRREAPHPEAPHPSEHQAPGMDGVMGMLGSLSQNQRACIVLHYYCDLPVRRVAQVLRVSPATVRVHLFRGRGHLRSLLGREDEE